MLLSVIRRNLPALTRSALKVSQIQPKYVAKTTGIPLTTHNLNLMIKRYKSKKKQSEKIELESESEEETKSEDEIQDKHSKIVKTTLSSLRMDSVLKSGLGMARNKIETLFYESKIRINGEKVLKKSKTVKVGDEIDIIKGVDIKNPNFLVVARVEILEADPAKESFKVKLRRTKSLTIENYKEEWKGGPITP